MEETAEKIFNSLKNFIEKRQTITRLNNGNYMIFSKEHSMITVMEISKKKYIEYWTGSSPRCPKEYKARIARICENKLENGLISIDEMIDLVKFSNDIEKDEALKLLRRKR